MGTKLRKSTKNPENLKKPSRMNNNYNHTMDTNQYYDLVPIVEEYYEESTYTPSEVSDPDYMMENYSPPAKMARKAPAPTPIESRPGRAPKISDDQLTATELERRNRRRARNREAAARQRNRRMAKVGQLENEVKQLTESNQSLVSENERLRAELEKLRFNMKVNQPPVKKAPKRQAPAPVKIEQSHPQIPDDLFTPGGNFVLQTPAELKEQSFFPMETTKTETELIKKEIVRQDSFSEDLNLL